MRNEPIDMNHDKFHSTIARTVAVVVNDDLTQIELLSGLLAKEGLEVQPFSNATSALQAMSQAAPPDLIVTDLYMPGIDGWRFCRLLRSPEYAPFNQTPILVVSATFAGEVPERIAADLGANAFLPSPVDGRDFAEQVRRLLRGEPLRKFPRVLIVDDDAALAGLLKESFEAHGYQADAVLTGREAQISFQTSRYDFVIIDQHLPDITGDQLLGILQSHCGETAFLGMTGDSSPDQALAWMQRGAAAFVRKPFAPQYLIELCVRARRERDLLRLQDRLEQRTRELRHSEAMFRSITENAFDLMALLDTSGRYLYCNDTYTEILGYLPAELMGQSCFELVHPEDRERAKQTFKDALAQGKVTGALELRLLCRNGQCKQILHHARILNEEANPRRILLNARDVTAQKEAEAQLAKAHGLLSGVLDHTHMMVALLDSQFNFIWVNPAYAQTCRHEISFFPGKNHFDLYPHTENRAIFQRVVDTGEPFFAVAKPFEYPDQPDRGVTYWDWGLVPAKDQLGQVTGLVLTLADVTERIRAELALRASEEKYHGIFEESVATIYVFDNQKHFVDSNQAGLDLLGYSREELLRLSIPDVDADPIAVLPAHQTLLSGGRIINCEHSLRRKDGTIITVLNNSRPLTDSRGNVIGLLSTLSDITQSKQAEAKATEDAQRYRALIAVSNTGAWEWHSDKAYLWCSPEYFTILGWNPSGFDLSGAPNLKETWIDLLHPEDRDQAKNHFLNYLDSGSLGMYENCFRMRHRDGHWKWILSRGMTLRDSNGNPSSRTVGTHIDITIQKQTEISLRRTTDLLDATRLAQSSFIAHGNPQTTFEALLHTLVSLSDSQFGFLDEILWDESGSPYKLNLALSDISWSPETRNLYEQLKSRQLKFTNLNNLAGLPALTGKSVIANDAQHDPRAGGLPPNHPPIHSFLGLPVYFGDQLVGVAGVANRANGYDGETVCFLQPFLAVCGSIIHAIRLQCKERNAIAQLEASEHRHRTVLETAMDGFICVDTEGRLQEVNEAYVRMSGYDRESLLTMHISDLEAVEAIADTKARIQKILATGQDRFETRHRRNDGSQYDVEVSVLYRPEASGLMHVFIRDITARIRTDREIRKLYQAVEQSPVSIVITDPTGAIEYVNPVFTQLTGYPMDEVCGQNPRFLKGDKTTLEEYRHLWQTITAGGQWHGEFHNRRKNGTLYWENATISPIVDAQGRITHFLAVKEDITERKALESQLRQAQKLESIGRQSRMVASSSV